MKKITLYEMSHRKFVILTGPFIVHNITVSFLCLHSMKIDNSCSKAMDWMDGIGWDGNLFTL